MYFKGLIKCMKIKLEFDNLIPYLSTWQLEIEHVVTIGLEYGL